MKSIAIIGNTLVQSATECRNLGYEPIVIFKKSRPDAAKIISKCISANIRYLSIIEFSIEEVLRKIKDSGIDISGVFTQYEPYVRFAHQLARSLGLPHSSAESLVKATDKIAMRQAFVDHDRKISPQFAEVKSLSDAKNFASRYGYPLVLKPANLMKSLLVSVVSNEEELELAYARTSEALDNLYRKHNVDSIPKILIEEFLKGTMHTVAYALGDNSQPILTLPIVDVITASEAGFSDNFLFARRLPSKLEPLKQTELFRVALEGVRALGLSNTPAHIELILTSEGPKIIEIGARIGGYRNTMYRKSADTSYLKHVLTVATAGNTETQSIDKAARSCAVVELFPKNRGTFRGIKGLEAIESFKSFSKISVRAIAGKTEIGLSKQGFKYAAVLTLVESGGENLDEILAKIQEEITVNIK